MDDVRLAAQLENTLVISVVDLLRGAPPTSARIANLSSFIQASILFDQIHLPGRSERSVSPLTVLPAELQATECFIYHPVTDATERREWARNRILTLVTEGDGSVTFNRRSGEVLLDIVYRTVRDEGKGWLRAFQTDIAAVLAGNSPYQYESVPRALQSLEGIEYTAMSPEHILAIYYYIKTFYNIRLAVDYRRVFFGNFARTPLIGSAYEHLADPYVRTPLLKRLISSGKSHWIAVMKEKSAAVAWEIAVPTLVDAVLRLAQFERAKVPEAILAMRDSNEARAFREHFQSLLNREPGKNPLDDMTKDIQALVKRWTALSPDGWRPASLITPLLRHFLNQKEIFNIYKDLGIDLWYLRHLRIFWKQWINSNSFDSGAAEAVQRTFGQIVD